MGGANGLIVAFVVAVWAAYVVPLVLRRYDEASTAESLDVLSPLSRVVHRRRAASEDEDTEAATPASTSSEPAPLPEPARVVSPTQRRAAVVAARRRRRTLLTLLAALTLVGGLAGFRIVDPVWVAAPAALVVAWLVACRVQVRAERGIGRSEQSPSAPSAEAASESSARETFTERPASRRRSLGRSLGVPRSARPGSTAGEEESTVVVSGQVEDVDPGRKHVMQRAELEVDALDEQLQIAVPSVATSGAALWDPLPVTLPTYVTKPRVGRTVRTIDFDAPGVWTSGHVEGEDVELPGARPETAQTAEAAPRRVVGE